LKKVIVIFVSLITLLYPSIDEFGYNEQEIKILQSFDIDPEFVNDTQYIKIKNFIQTSLKDKFLTRLDNGSLVIPILKQEIKKSGIPESFLYLAMAESSFILRAYSHKRASGLWQFMPYTGRRYGLDINLYLDERRDIIKSTQAAIEYLQKLHTYFGKWYLAILSYNCGEGRVAEAIIRSCVDEYIRLNPTQKKSSKVKYMKKFYKRFKKGKIYK